MKRALRAAFPFVAAGSALLFLATCVLWAASYWTGIHGSFRRLAVLRGTSPPRHARDYAYAVVARGGLLVQWQHAEFGAVAGAGPAPGFEWQTFRAPGYPYPYDNPGVRLPRTAENRIRLLGFELVRPKPAPAAPARGKFWVAVRSCTVPLPAVVVLWSIGPIWWCARYRKDRGARRGAAGLCRSCGYDLRATPADPREGGTLLDRCPECGAARARSRRLSEWGGPRPRRSRAGVSRRAPQFMRVGPVHLTGQR